jgi:DNA-binding response OmpR family regulator
MLHSVLIIDDEAGVSLALAIRLRAAGFDASTADSGFSGLAAAHLRPPDAIVLDMRMPDMDGFEAFTRLRLNPHLADIPVVFLSANVQDSARQAALAAGATAYLTKPFDAREVVAVLREAIERRGACRFHTRDAG